MSNGLKELVQQIQFIKKWNVEQVAQSIGYSRVHLTREYSKEGKSPLEKKLRDLHADVLQDVSHGNKPKKNVTYVEQRHQQKLITVPTIPFYDAEAMAGTEYGADMTTITHPTGKIDIGDLLRDSKAALRVYGNSMIPGYPPGCVIGLVQNTEMIIHPGHVYVVETGNNRFVKRLYYTKDQKGLLCVSDNILQHHEGPLKGEYFYPPFEIPFEKVKRLFEVTGVIKRNQSTMIVTD